VVVHNFHFVGISVAPHKADAPLIVDANAVLPSPVPVESFQAIASRSSQIGELPGKMYLVKFAPGYALDGLEPPHEFPLKDLFGIGVSEGPDHNSTI
jgi:hypothetical protein